VCLGCGLALMLTIGSFVTHINTASLDPDTLTDNLESKRGYNVCKNSFARAG